MHLFCQCPYTTTFWKDLSRYITDKLVSDLSLLWEDVLFGFHDNKSKKLNEIYLINLLIILGKYIHKAKLSNSKPSFIAFGREIRKLLNPFGYALFLKYLFETPPGFALDQCIFCITDCLLVLVCIVKI